MTHGIFPTLAIVVIGLFAARMGDLLRTDPAPRKPCDNEPPSRVAWSYNADSANQESAWQRVQPHEAC